MSNDQISIREGRTEDIAIIQQLILEHGPNPWNHLPEDEVRHHVEGIATEITFAVLALIHNSVIGVVTYEIGRRYPQYQPSEKQDNDHGYLAEAVVHRKYAGKGIGTQLLKAAIERLLQQGIHEVYAMRHADNIPSGRMMEKSGMKVVDEFDDPEIRNSGSRRTSVSQIIVLENNGPHQS